MKANWAEKALEDVCSIDYGTRIVRKHSVGTEYPVYGGGNETFRAGHYNRTDTVVVARFAMSEECTRFVKGQFFLNDSGLTVAPLQEDLLTCDYVNAWLLASNVQIFALGRGTAQRNLDVPAFRRMTFRFPTSIDEQRRIVAKLDAISAQVAAATENRKAKALALKAARSALLQQLCTEPHSGAAVTVTVPLGQILSLEYGKPLPATERDEFDGQVAVFGANGVKSRTHTALIDQASIVVGRKGSAGEVNLTHGPFWPLDVTYFVRHDAEETDLMFLYYLLISLDLPRLAKGVKPGLNRNDAYSIRVPLPPLDEQRRIVAKLDEATAAIASLESGVDSAARELDALTSSVLSSLLVAS